MAVQYIPNVLEKDEKGLSLVCTAYYMCNMQVHGYLCTIRHLLSANSLFNPLTNLLRDKWWKWETFLRMRRALRSWNRTQRGESGWQPVFTSQKDNKLLWRCRGILLKNYDRYYDIIFHKHLILIGRSWISWSWISGKRISWKSWRRLEKKWMTLRVDPWNPEKH